MNTKTAKIIYWTGVTLTSFWFGASGYFELTKNALVWEITRQLGYPAHFIYLLGVAKVAGVIVWENRPSIDCRRWQFWTYDYISLKFLQN